MDTDRLSGRVNRSDVAAVLVVALVVLSSSVAVVASPPVSGSSEEQLYTSTPPGYSETVNKNVFNYGTLGNFQGSVANHTLSNDYNGSTFEYRANITVEAGSDTDTVYATKLRNASGDSISLVYNDETDTSADDDEFAVFECSGRGSCTELANTTVDSTFVADGDNVSLYMYAEYSASNSSWHVRLENKSGDVFGGESSLDLGWASSSVSPGDFDEVQHEMLASLSSDISVNLSTIESGSVDFENAEDSTRMEVEGYRIDSSGAGGGGGDGDVDDEDKLRIETREYLKHNTTVPFEVWLYNDSTDSYDNVTTNPDLNVTVGNTSVVTVSGASITSTNDTTINQVTWVNATWEPTGVNDSQEVVVANETIENVDILPPMQKFTASVGTPDMQVVLIATGVGAGIGLLATSLAGIGGFTLVIIAGWLGGYSETHTLIAGLLIALFVGLNVSQLVEFNGR